MGRIASVAVSVRTMSFLGTPNCCARVSIRKTTTKKSKASRVQPRKPAITAWRAPVLPEVSFISAGTPLHGPEHSRRLLLVLLRNRSARAATRKHVFHESPIFDHEHAVDKHKLDSLGM